MEPHHQPSPRPQPQPAWETTLLRALQDPAIVTEHAGTIHIDCSLLERTLSANTALAFFPARSNAVADKLKDLGIHIVSSLAPSHAELFGSPGKYIGQYLGETTVDFYNGVFSNPHCSLYLAPTLLGTLIYSNTREVCTEQLTRKNGIIAVFRDDFLSSSAMSGMLGELRRNLLLRYAHGQSVDPERFVNYANGLPLSEHEHHRPFFVEHARAAITRVMTEKLELPAEMVALLQTSCGTRLFHNFRYTTITPWLENKLHEITHDFNYCHRFYNRIFSNFLSSADVSSETSEWDDEFCIGIYGDPAEELVLLEDDIDRIKSRFSACLELMLYADDGCVHFHRKHVQDADIAAGKELSDEGEIAPIDPEPPPNSRLLQSLTRCTSAMLRILGQPGLDNSLEIGITDEIAQLHRGRFQWYPDDYEAFETFYREDVANCLVRFIENLDFQSACALIIIAPTSTTENGALALPLEIEGPIIESQELICRKIAEKAKNIARSIRTTTSFLGWEHIEEEIQELKRAVTTFLLPINREFGSNELSLGLGTLTASLALRGQQASGAERSSIHRGFELILDIFQQFGERGSSYVGDLFATVLKSSPKIKAEFSNYISTCNLLAQDLLIDQAARPHKLSDNEKHMLAPTRLYRLLPSTFRSEGIASPSDCTLALKALHRGRTLRDRISTLERGAELQPRETASFDLQQQLAILREAQNRQSHGDSSIPLATSKSLVRLLKRGAINLDPAVKSLIGEADRVIATAILPELRRSDDSVSHEIILADIFSAESSIISSVILTVRSGNPNDVTRSADVASEFYDVASKRIGSRDAVMASSMSALSGTFSALSADLKNLSLAGNRNMNKREQRKVQKILRDFVQSETIQKLIEDLHISA